VLYQIHRDMLEGRPPEESLLNGACVLAGAVLLLTPGVFTDLLGLALLIPPSRRFLCRQVRRLIERRMRRRAGIIDVEYKVVGDKPAE
jgi:UPF0716 protein FxsA